MKTFTLLDAPDHKSKEAAHYLYATEFHDGTIKVGMTRNVRHRLRALQRQYRRKAVRVYAAPCHSLKPHAEESLALAVCSRIGNTVDGKELFGNLSFGAAATAVAQMARRSGNEGPVHGAADASVNRLRAMLADANLCNLAAITGLNVRTLRRIKNGDSVPNMSTSDQIVKALRKAPRER